MYKINNRVNNTGSRSTRVWHRVLVIITAKSRSMEPKVIPIMASRALKSRPKFPLKFSVSFLFQVELK